MSTAQTLISEARNTLQDDGTRYPDTDLLVGLNDGLKLIRSVRPDLWYGSLATPLVALVLGDAFPLAPEYEPAIKEYVIHYASMREDEYSVSGRAAAFLKKFISEVEGQ